MPKEKLYLRGDDEVTQYVQLQWVRDGGAIQVDKAEDNPEQTGRIVETIFLDSWQQVNRLVGLLKQARDSAFGRPE